MLTADDDGQDASLATVIITELGVVYQVLDPQGGVLARIMWDGVSPYDVEEVYGPGTLMQREAGR